MISKICKNIVYIIAFFVILYILCINTNIIFGVIFAIVVGTTIFYLKNTNNTVVEKEKIYKKNKINNFIDKYFAIIIFTFAFILRIVGLYIFNVTPSSDPKLILEAAQSLVNGENVLNTANYFSFCPYQTGSVLYQAVVLILFNNNIVGINYLDCIYTATICLLIYLIAKELFNDKVAKFSAVMYAITILHIGYVGVMSDQHLAGMLILIAFYIAISDKIKMKKSIKFATIGVLLGVSDIIRSEAILYIVIFFVFWIISIKDKQEFKESVKGILMCIISFIIVTQGASYLIKITDINQYGLKNNDVLWKFVCAANFETKGQYSADIAKKVQRDSQKEIDYIKENIKSKSLKQHLKLFHEKEKIFWKDGYYSLFLNQDDININANVEDIKQIVQKYDTVIYVIVLICANIYMFYAIINNKKNQKVIMILLTILANFFVYQLIEIQPRYSYLPRIMLYILAAGGVNVIIDNIKLIRKNKVD